MTDNRGDLQGDQLTGGGSRKRGSLRRDSESSRGFNCDLLSLATVRSHSSRGRFQSDNNSSDKEERATCLGDKEGGR